MNHFMPILVGLHGRIFVPKLGLFLYRTTQRQKKTHPTFKLRLELKLMIAALDGMHSDGPGVLKGTENDKHEYSDPKTQIYARFMCYFLFLTKEIVRKITH